MGDRPFLIIVTYSVQVCWTTKNDDEGKENEKLKLCPFDRIFQSISSRLISLFNFSASHNCAISTAVHRKRGDS